MRELFNRVSSLDLAKKISGSDSTVFIVSAPEWIEKKKKKIEKTRGNVCQQRLKPKNVIEIKYQSRGVNSERIIEDQFTAKFDDSSQDVYDSLDIDSMKEFVNNINSKYKSMIVDITLINIRFLGAFLAILPYYKWETIYFCYTEPGEYIQQTDEEMRTFDMKYSTLGFDEIPNLQTQGDNTSECEWVVFMGFEGARLKKLEAEAAPQRRYVIPVMCIPSMQVEWHNYAIETNMEFIEGLKEAEQLKYVSAVNPFEVHNFLEEEKQKNNMRMKISPVGTKLTALGSIMYVLGNPDDMILTDNPYQEDENSIDFGISYCYDLSCFVKESMNKRFICEEEDYEYV